MSGVLALERTLMGKSASEDWKLQRLRWSIQALAMPADIQLALYPDFVVKADELALEFDENYELVDRSTFESSQLLALDKLNGKLEAMSAEGTDYYEDLWFDESELFRSNHWEEVRELAIAVLNTLRWPVEKPPEDPEDRGATYVGR